MVDAANFEGWGYREISEAATLLELWSDQKLTQTARDYFEDNGTLTANFNSNSGAVFLSNDNYEVLVEEDGKLEMLFVSPNGLEGTLSALEAEKEYMEEDDLEWFNDLNE